MMKWQQAVQLANEVYGETLFKEGEPLLMHAMKVASKLETEDEQITALLAHVLNFGYHPLELLAKGVPGHIVGVLNVFSDSYNPSYYERVRKNPLAKTVDIASLNVLIAEADNDEIKKQFQQALAKLEKENEDTLVKMLKKHLEGNPIVAPNPLALVRFFEQYENLAGVSLNKDQVHAVITSIVSNVSGINGNPFTGITQSLDAILCYYSNIWGISDARMVVLSAASPKDLNYLRQRLNHHVLDYQTNKLGSLAGIHVVVLHHSSRMNSDELVRLLSTADGDARIIFVDNEKVMAEMEDNAAFSKKAVYDIIPVTRLSENIRKPFPKMMFEPEPPLKDIQTFNPFAGFTVEQNAFGFLATLLGLK